MLHWLILNKIVLIYFANMWYQCNLNRKSVNKSLLNQTDLFLIITHRAHCSHSMVVCHDFAKMLMSNLFLSCPGFVCLASICKGLVHGACFSALKTDRGEFFLQSHFCHQLLLLFNQMLHFAQKCLFNWRLSN